MKGFSCFNMFHKTLFLWTLFAYLQFSTSRPLNFSSRKSLQDLFQSRCNVTRSPSICPELHPKCCCSRIPSSHSTYNLAQGFAHQPVGISLFVICADVDHVPPLPERTEKLTLERTNIRVLSQSSFNKTLLSKSLTFCSISHNDNLQLIKARTFSGLDELRDIYIENDKKLSFIDETAFSNLPKLSTLKLKKTGLATAEGFTELGTPSGPMIAIQLSHNDKLKTIQSKAFFNLTQRVNVLEITWNSQLQSIQENAFLGSSITRLRLDNNEALSELSSNAFYGMKNLINMSLDNTPITSLPTGGLQKLQTLSFQNTHDFIHFPTSSELPSLREASATYSFHCCALIRGYGFGELYTNFNDTRVKIDCETGEKIKEKWVTVPVPESPDLDYTEGTYFPNYNDYPDEFNYQHYDTASNVSYNDDEQFINLYVQGLTNDGHEIVHNLFDITTDPLLKEDPTYWESEDSSTLKSGPQRVCYEDENGQRQTYVFYQHPKCTPLPDAFNPCENVLGATPLVVISWMVSCLAVTGNLFIVFILLAGTIVRSYSHQRRISVPKFLMLNLAIGDFCMGIYIMALSVMDSKSSGHYYSFAEEWQTRGGCDVVGFISIFASQLSVYTLSVISLERWYAIRFAIQLERRMTLKCGHIVMAIGWIACILFAFLPLVGVNSYRKNALCLPMDVKSASGKAYIAAILALDVVAFVVVLVSYVSMYVTVRSANGRRRMLPEVFRLQQRRSTEENRAKKSKSSERCYGVIDSRKADARVAKKMGFLVFTDFACFFPISFFSLFALAGFPLLTISTAKILIVLCYPFNSCCNPFLYAFLTKSFRHDVTSFIQSQKHCLYGDDRQKATGSRMVEKRSDGSSRHEERRKTIQVYVEGEVDKSNGEAVDLKMASHPKHFNGILKNDLTNVQSESSRRSSGKSRFNFHINSARGRNSRCSGRSSVSTSRSPSVEPIQGQLDLSRIFKFFRISLPKHRKRPTTKPLKPLVRDRNSFETQLTSNGATSSLSVEKKGKEEAEIERLTNVASNTPVE